MRSVGYASSNDKLIHLCEAAEAGRAETLEWGGNWTSFVDKPHYQLKTGLPLKILKAKFEIGENYTIVV